MTETAYDNLLQRVGQLRQIYPVTGLIHVGSGLGLGAMHQWRTWSVQNALLIEADSERSTWMDTALAENPGWHRMAEAISAMDGDAEFLVASNPAESGLIDPTRLKPIWPHLHTVGTRRVATRRLDNVLSDVPVFWRPDWLLIDCLPALPVMQGANNALEDCSVIWARVVLDETLEGLAEAKLSDIERYLAPLDFRCIAVAEGMHPSVGEALFVRDWRARLSPRIEELQEETTRLGKAHDEARARHAALEAEKEILAGERDEQSKLAADRQVQIDQLGKVRDEQTKLATERQQRIEALIQERDEQAKLTGEWQVQVDLLGKARDDQAKLAGEWQVQVDLLGKARDDQAKLAAQHEVELNQLEAQVQQKDARIAQLETELAERDARQNLLNEEMLKAEAQIELIKDVLLREPGL